MKRFLSICAAAALGVATLSAPAWADENVQEPVSAPESTEQVQSDPEPEIVAESPAPVVEEVPAVIEEAPVPQVEVAQPIEEPVTSLARVADIDYVLALWKINATAPEIWPGQTLADSVSLDEPSLDALDNSEALTCGTRYQVDLYLDDEVTAALIAGAVLDGPNNPAEHLANGAVDGNPWKYLTTAECPKPTVAACETTSDGPTSTNLDNAGWTFAETRATGHNDYVEGGLHVWTESNTSTDKAAGYHALSIPLGQAGEPSINLSDTSGGLPSIQIGLDRDGNGTWDGYLVNEGDIYGHGNWWTNKTGFGVPAGGGYPSMGTLTDYLQANPDAQIVSFGYSLGSGVLGSAVINSITVGCTTYTFDFQEVVVEPTSVTPSWSYTDACGVDNDEFFLGDEEGIEYQYDGEQFVTVRALALFKIALADGSPFVLNEDGTAILDVSPFFTDEPCATETPTPTPSVTPTETPSATPTTTPTVAPVVSQIATPAALASTGSDGVVWTIFIAAMLIVAGFVIFLLTRRSAVQPPAHHRR